MKHCGFSWNKLFAVLCILIMVTYALAIFLPHTHGEFDADCAVCAIIDERRELDGNLEFSSAITFSFGILASAFVPTYVFCDTKITPITLKVKLSD